MCVCVCVCVCMCVHENLNTHECQWYVPKSLDKMSCRQACDSLRGKLGEAKVDSHGTILDTVSYNVIHGC